MIIQLIINIIFPISLFSFIFLGLHRLAIQAKLKGYEKLTKDELFSKLKTQFNLDRLQRITHRNSGKRPRELDDNNKSSSTSSSSSSSSSRSSSSSSSSSATSSNNTSSSSSSSSVKRKKKALNKDLNKTNSSNNKTRNSVNMVDPIMFVPIKRNSFKFLRPNGSAVVFNVESLIDYMLLTGNFHDPETRLEFSDNNLRTIDTLAKKASLGKPSVYDAKHNPSLFENYKFQRDALLSLERCAGDIITEILNIIETYDVEEAQMALFLQSFPVFADYYQQLKSADSEFASQCIDHWRNYILGPPNHPTEDSYGLVSIVLQFLNTCEES